MVGLVGARVWWWDEGVVPHPRPNHNPATGVSGWGLGGGWAAGWLGGWAAGQLGSWAARRQAPGARRQSSVAWAQA